MIFPPHLHSFIENLTHKLYNVSCIFLGLATGSCFIWSQTSRLKLMLCDSMFVKTQPLTLYDVSISLSAWLTNSALQTFSLCLQESFGSIKTPSKRAAFLCTVTKCLKSGRKCVLPGKGK